MIRLIVKGRYGENFAKYKLVPFVRKAIISELHNKKYALMHKYVSKYYDITPSDIIKLMTANIEVMNDRAHRQIVISINPNIKLKDKITLDQIIRLYDYGNRDVRGTNLFISLFRSIEENADMLYKISIIRKGNNNLWL